MKIATTIGEMRGFAATAAEAVEMYAGTGFKYLDYNFYHVLDGAEDPFMQDGWQEEILAAKAAAAKNGFAFVQAHAPGCRICGGNTEREILAVNRAIAACGMLGIKNMVIHSGFLPGYTYPDDMQAYCKAIAPFFRALIPAMEKHSVHMLFENTTEKHCRGRFFPIYGRDLNAMIDYFGHPLFGAAWDVGHANMDDIDHAAQIREMGGNLRAIHVHDNYGEKDLHLLPLMGSTDFDNLMQGLLQTGFSGYFTLEIKNNFYFERRAGLTGPLAHPPAEIKKAALRLQYSVAKAILEAYNVYEE